MVDTMRRLVLLLALAAFVSVAGAAEVVAKRTYALAAGDAAATLRQFAEQSGEQVVYVVTKVRGVTTNAVRGRFTAREALEQMLARTGLAIVEDSKSGAWLVQRPSATQTNESSAPPPVFSPPASMPTSPPRSALKTNRPLSLLGTWLAFVLGTTPALHSEEGGAAVGIVQGRVENALSGDYLANVRVSIEGEAAEALTNMFGEFRIEKVTPGERQVRASIVGYAPQSRSVKVDPNATATVQFALQAGGAAGPAPAVGGGEKEIVLAAFVVESQRTMSGSSVAINERRAAPNLKNVVASDEFGDSTEGNVAEFVKHIPGIAIDYNAADARYISIRGLPSFGTAVMIDGNRMASAADNFSRGAEFNQVSLNNMSLIEVTKSPLPDTPGDSVGGSVNMVLKSAFERSRPVLNYRANLNANFSRASEENLVRLNRMPGPRGSVSTMKPSFDVTLINPVTKNFGFTLSLLNANQYSPAATITPTWRPTSSGTSLAPADQPFLGSVLYSDRPREGFRWSSGATLDWRLSPRDILTVGAQWNRFETILDYHDLQFDPTGNSTVKPTAYDETSMQGAPGAGRVTWGVTTYHKFMLGNNVSLSYRHRGPVWTIAAGSALSRSKTYVESAEDGVIKSLSLRSPATTILYSGIDQSRPAAIATTTSAGAPVSFADLGWYSLQSVTQGTPQNYGSTTNSAFANATRFLPFAVPVKVKVGLDVRREERDTTNPTATLTFVGPDGVANSADDSVSLYDLVNTDYSRLAMPFGLGRVQRPSSSKTFRLLQEHPDYFREDAAATYRSAVTNSKEFAETVAAGYLRTDFALFQNRLKLAGGVRYERTYDKGKGMLNDPVAVLEKDAAGRLRLDAAGKPIRRTGTALELAQLQYQERGAQGSTEYGNLFPSANAAYSLTEKLVLRTSYAQTITRPQINNVVPSTTVTDPTSTAIPTITVNNPALRPWTADNYDLTLEYYFDQPGLVSVGVFRKDIRNFFGSVRTRATSEQLAEYGFDDSYLGYDIATRENVGKARISGFEFDYRQSLTFLPSWARGLSIFANGTLLRSEGPARADLSGFIKRTGNWGFNLSRPRYTLRFGWNYRGEQNSGLVTGTNVPENTYRYNAPRLSLEMNVEVRLARHLTLFSNVRNVTDIPWLSTTYSPVTPAYARTTNWVEYGPQAIFGIKGSF